MQTAPFNILASNLIDQAKDWSFVLADGGETVEDVIKKFGRNQITSAPVMQNGKCLGMVDMLDLLTYASGKMGLKVIGPVSSKRAAEEFLHKPILDLMNVSGRNSALIVPHTATILAVMDVLSRPDQHRILVKNETGNLIGLITQSRIVRFLSENKSKLESPMNLRIDQIWNFRERIVECIDWDEFVIDAMMKLEESRVSGIAVTDNGDQIVGNISASDLKRMQVDSPLQLCYDIYQPIKLFLNISDDPHAKKLPKFHPIFVNPSDTLGQVIDLVNSKSIHRVYVVDSKKKLMGEVSLCDIIAKFVPHGAK
jgi:CBS domain-containing protein